MFKTLKLTSQFSVDYVVKDSYLQMRNGDCQRTPYMQKEVKDVVISIQDV